MLAIIFRGTNEPRSAMCVATFICGEIWMLTVVPLVALLWLLLRTSTFTFAFGFVFASAHTILCTFVSVYLRMCLYVYRIGKCKSSIPQQLRMQTYLCGYVPLHIFSKFYISRGRQAASENISLALFASSLQLARYFRFGFQVSDSSAYARHLQRSQQQHAG